MQSKIIQIIPAPPNVWVRWKPTEKGEQEEYSPIRAGTRERALRS